jgi:hypothetical protein
MTKNEEKFTDEIFVIFLIKSCYFFYLFLGLHKGRPGYRSSLHPSKEYIFCGSFWPSWIRIHIPNADPDPADQNECGSGSTTLILGVHC